MTTLFPILGEANPGQRVGVMGLGQTGWSAVQWLRSQGFHVVVADTRQAPPYALNLQQTYPDIKVHFGELPETWCAEVDWVLLSPGIAADDPGLAMARARAVPMLGDVEVAARYLAWQGSRPLLLAVTGSNGKSTVVSLLGAMAVAQGRSVAVAGNIGLPVLEVLGRQPWPEVLVLELSSFQLETLTFLNADSAVVLNVTEDHMDRYPDMSAYAKAKRIIYSGCGHPVANRDDPWNVQADALTFGLDEPEERDQWGVGSWGGEEWLVEGRRRIMKCTELRLPGRHNRANALAALAMGRAVGWELSAMVAVLREFTGLPHRVETVAVVAGVTYIDDSKGTNVGATVAALSGMSAPVILIAGGDGKNQDFSPLGEAIRAYAKAVALIGRDGPLIAQAMGQAIPQRTLPTLPDAVRWAAGMAAPGDVVLMSPACASFDMFDHYVHRAEVFRGAVNQLPFPDIAP